MKKSALLGLIGAGSASSSPLAQLPKLLRALGPVKSSSLRLSSRLANALGAGYPVDQYEALEPCPIIFIFVPDGQIRDIIAELARAPLDWNGKSVILADTWFDSSFLQALANRGAETGSICLMDAAPESRLLVEGSRVAVSNVKRVLSYKARHFQVSPETKPLVHAALTLTESLVFPLLHAAEECLRMAEIPHLQAEAFRERMMLRASRNYAKAGRKGWTGPLAIGNAELLQRNMEELRARDAALAHYFLSQCIEALRYFRKDIAALTPSATESVAAAAR